MKHKTIALVFLLVFGVSQAAYAEDTQTVKSKPKLNIVKNMLDLPFEMVAEPFFNLGKIVITPTRTAENVESLGSAVSVFTKEELDVRGIYTVKDALRK